MGGRRAPAPHVAPAGQREVGVSGLHGAVAVVTGASRGLGASYAAALAGAGADVVALARRFDHVDSPADDATAGVVRIECDLRDDQAMAEAVDHAMVRFGRIDVLVNCAAVYPRFDPFEVGSDAWDHVLGLNVVGAYRAIRSVAPVMAAAGRGSIVNISANAASHTTKGHPGHDGRIAYAVSKAALERLNDYVAEELREADVAVNVLRPGGVLTESWREVDPDGYQAAERSGRGQRNRPEVVGPPLLHLAIQRAGTMTGEVVDATQFGTVWGT